MADTLEMFGPTREFSGMADSMEPCKMLWADPCCHGLGVEIQSPDPVRLVAINDLLMSGCCQWSTVHISLVFIQLCLVLSPLSSSCTCILLSTFLSPTLFSTCPLVILALQCPLNCHLQQLRLITRSLSVDAAMTLLQSFISCHLDYCNSLFSGITDSLLRRLQSVQNAAA